MSKQSRRRRSEERKRRQSEPQYRSASLPEIKVEKQSAFVKGAKAVGGFLNRMFFRARLTVAFPFLLVGMVLVVPKDSLEFFGEAWDMFKRGGV